MVSDFSFAAHAWSLARLHRARGWPTFRYRFAAMPDAMAERFAGTPHAGELSYVFNTLQHSGWPTTERDARVAAATIAYWISFARDHALSPPALPAGVPVDDDLILHISNRGAAVELDDRAPRYRALAAIVDPRS
jgi:para-nitrobenzyl esterase